MAQTDFKSELMAEIEAEIDKLVDWDQVTPNMKLTDIEDKLLGVRQRIGELVAKRMIERQEEKRAKAIPESRSSGKRLHPKGKKRDASSHS
jgi:hypothetical protein